MTAPLVDVDDCLRAVRDLRAEVAELRQRLDETRSGLNPAVLRCERVVIVDETGTERAVFGRVYADSADVYGFDVTNRDASATLAGYVHDVDESGDGDAGRCELGMWAGESQTRWTVKVQANHDGTSSTETTTR